MPDKDNLYHNKIFLSAVIRYVFASGNKLSFIFIITFLFNVICKGQPVQIPQIEFSPKKYICYKSGEALNIDGSLAEPGWSKAEWTEDFVDIEGSARPLPRFYTRAKMLWDENYFYIAAEMEEPDIWGTLENRDDIIFYDNDFEIFIDPDGDTHSYCEFEMNALNTVWDLLLIQPYRDINKAAIHGWDIKGLQSGVAVYGSLNEPGTKDSCWTVEVAFPWKAFEEITYASVPPKDGEQWRINFSRVEWKTEVRDNRYRKVINPETNRPFAEDNWVWSPQGIINMHYPEMWGFVQFSDEIAGNRESAFIEKEEENVKWFLRKLYYLERIYFDKNGSFTADIKKLGLAEEPPRGYQYPPTIEYTSSMFEASMLSADGSEKIIIRENGLITISGN